MTPSQHIKSDDMDQAYDDLYVKHSDQKAIACALRGSLQTALAEISKLKNRLKNENI